MFNFDNTKPIDVTGIGNAILDILAFMPDEFITEQGMNKGDMMLIDEARAQELYDHMGETQEASGGSAANTLAGIASLGGKAAFVGRVRNDQFGKIYRHDLTAIGVRYDMPDATEGPATGCCYIMVTPDGERTMNTYLGAGSQIYADDIDEALIKDSKIVFSEGYQWCNKHNIEAIRKAYALAKEHGALTAFTMSAVFCVDQYREQFQELIPEMVDILFANEAELNALYPEKSTDEILDILSKQTQLTIFTRSEKGSIIVAGDERIDVPAKPVSKVTDATGAGDLYAAGFFYGLTQGLPLARCGELGSACASQIIQQLGARAMKPLQELVA